MTALLFNDHSNALTVEADFIEKEGHAALINYFKNNVYHNYRFQKSVESYFHALKDKWLADTRFSSSINSSLSHPLYHEILMLGENIVPLLLKDLIKNRTHWFFALSQLTGENPIKPAHAGNLDQMIDDWTKWGEEHGVI